MAESPRDQAGTAPDAYYLAALKFCEKWQALKPEFDLVVCAMREGALIALSDPCLPRLERGIGKQ